MSEEKMDWEAVSKGLKILSHYKKGMLVWVDSDVLMTDCAVPVSEMHKELLLKYRWWREGASDIDPNETYPGALHTRWFWSADPPPGMEEEDEDNEDDEDCEYDEDEDEDREP